MIEKERCNIEYSKILSSVGLIHTVIRIMLTYLRDGAAIEDLVAVLRKTKSCRFHPKYDPIS